MAFPSTVRCCDVIIIGGGLAGLSAAIYLGRSRRDTVLIHTNRSMAKWESDVQNYLGFPKGIDGENLLARGMQQVVRIEVVIVEEDIHSLIKDGETFSLSGSGTLYRARRVLLATGLTHLPPEIPGVRECLGRSLFFCKDCDAYQSQGKNIVIIGGNNEAADYALAMLAFTSSVTICTNGGPPQWDVDRAGWLEEYAVPIQHERIRSLLHHDGQLTGLALEGGNSVTVEGVFTTRDDLYHHDLATCVGAQLDEEGQIIVDYCLKTTVPGLYAAGCVTPANCQMIIAAGQGAIAGQAINRDLFEDSLKRHTLPRYGDANRIKEQTISPSPVKGIS
ncbi:MAG: NAD(P)/FAD-dependent oxidoreductase [Nitrospira sp.]